MITDEINMVVSRADSAVCALGHGAMVALGIPKIVTSRMLPGRMAASLNVTFRDQSCSWLPPGPVRRGGFIESRMPV